MSATYHHEVQNVYWFFEFTELIESFGLFFYWKRKDMVCSIKFQKLWTKTMRFKFFYAKHILLQNELVMVVHFSFIDILGIIFCHLLNALTIFMAAGTKFYCLKWSENYPIKWIWECLKLSALGH